MFLSVSGFLQALISESFYETSRGEKCSIVGNLSQELDFWFDSCCKMLVNITLENFSLMLKDPAVSLVPSDLFLLRILRDWEFSLNRSLNFFVLLLVG